MDWSTSFFKFGTLLYIIEEVKLSIVMLVLYKFMLGIFFIRKDSINFLWFTLPIWYRVEKLSIEIAWPIFCIDNFSTLYHIGNVNQKKLIESFLIKNIPNMNLYKTSITIDNFTSSIIYNNVPNLKKLVDQSIDNG